ncbi:hypothetical protein [Pseudoalteromonas sp. MMG022]|uniref:hypothetical protein n=1 Tax=Pseudoalteromonas sp. MMG022 TaxID=2909978 RepID=UPI001F2EBB50|nr:hypothetical protein [Pseudoalteromonas sp. MMG022]MCF6436665.1 hypothetical protein [Pseudoalteromonas sp. MMG022]
MKQLTLTALAHIALLGSIVTPVQAQNLDSTTLPILFFAQGDSYRALSPWYSLRYQAQLVELQTCSEAACIQSIKFNGLEATNSFDERNYHASFAGQAGGMKKQDTYSQLNLGQYEQGTLYASGNQRRITFTLQVSEQPSSLQFEFSDDYSTSISDDNASLNRISKACKSTCSTTWQAFNIDKDGRYTSAKFLPTQAGGWTVHGSNDAVKLELTTLIGQYQPPNKRHHQEDLSQSSLSLNQDSVIMMQQGELHNQYTFYDTQVHGMGDNHWLMSQDESLMLTDHSANVQSAMRIENLGLQQIISSDIKSESVFVLGVPYEYAKPRPSSRTIISQYPETSTSPMVATQLLELDHALNLLFATTIYLPESELPYATVELHEWGVLVGTGEAAAKSTSHSYVANQSSSAMAGCPMIASGYGYGLLCWKALNNPTLTYTPANSAMIPVTVVDNTTPTLMNQLEDNQHGIIFKDGSNPVDPGGSWTHPDNIATSKEDLALAIAMYHYRWGSPVAANIVYPVGSPSQPVMFREVEYQAANSSNLPHNVCNHFAASSGYPEYQAADACMTQTGFGLFSLMSLTFDRWQGGNYYPNLNVGGQDNSWFPWFTNFVGDPPVTDPFQAQASKEMAARIKHYNANYGRLIQDTYLNGQLFSQGTVAGYYQTHL